MQHDREQAIQDRAFAIWEQEGHPEGKDVNHWLQAEAEYEFELPKYLASLVAAVNDGAKAAQAGALLVALVGVYLLATSRSTSLAWSKSEIHGVGRVVARFFAGSDILLMPTMCSPPHRSARCRCQQATGMPSLRR